MHQFGFSIWGGGGDNYKIEKQNKQIKTFQVVLLTRPGVCVCGGGGGGGYCTQGRDRVPPPPSWANYFKSMQFFHQKLNLHP